ncbi:MAG: AbrB/MazE/SpoVT family DNA-binding domain-containing protein [archaeon]
MEILAKTRKIGGSLVVTIPKEVIKEQEIHEDELVEIEVKKRKRDFFGALRGIGEFKKEDRMKDRI